MRLLNEVQFYFVLSIALHAALIGSHMPYFQNTHKDSFEVEFERQEEILPRQHQIAKEKKIEKEIPKPEIQKDIVEEIADKAAVKPEETDEEIKRSLLRYQDSVKQRIQEEKRYPRSALRLGREGTARLFFILVPSGAIKDIRLLRSSGIADLDREAIGAVNRAGPFRPFPEGVGAQELNFEIDVAFMITKS
ncbi:MAG: energy transducer TonB [Candidatus Omnitrophica bacterium]|nr:energy transducer TonB [Candidatus Omnitrophota bacterium]